MEHASRDPTAPVAPAASHAARHARRLRLAALGPLDRASQRPPLPMPMRPAVATQKFLVVVELDGGNDALNMVVPQDARQLHAAPADDRARHRGRPRRSTAARSRPAVPPQRPHAAPRRRCTATARWPSCNRVGYPSGNQSHDTSKLIWSSGQREGLLTTNGWIARYAELAAPTPLGAVSVRRGRHRALTGGSSNPLTLDSLGAFRFDTDTAFTNNHRLRLEIVRELLQARASSVPRDALLTGHALADQLGAAVSGYTRP
jgi:uncharacterized protein (DUF1501 family)